MRRWTLLSRAEREGVILSGAWTTSTCYKPREIERHSFMPPTHQAVPWLPGGRRYQSPREPPVDRREELVSLSALALLLPQASQAHGRAQAVLSLGSDPRGDLVDLDEDACPLPVGVSKAG